jgi:integrase
MQERDNYVSAEKVKNSFLGFDQKQQTILELFDLHENEQKQQIGLNISEGTLKKYRLARRHIAEFLVFKFNLTDIPVKEINKQFISDFETYLFSSQQFSKNYIITLLKTFRHILEVGIHKEWIFRNPFQDIKLRWQKVDRGFLTQSEIETLIEFHFEDHKLERTRDIFIFCAFTGLSYSDVKRLTHDNIQSFTDGNMWIKGKRKKTDTDYIIPLLNIPKMILEKYKGKTAEGYLLPVVHLVWYNRLLIKIGKLCGIKKHISSHLARHSFATLTLNNGVSIESVSKMLGHTNIATTQIYAKITDKKVGNEMNIFAGNVKRMDATYQLTKVEEIKIEDKLQSLKIHTGKSSDTVWKTLTVNVWNKMSLVERQSFVSQIESLENKPKTICDFHVSLMGFFLENLNIRNEIEPSSNLDTGFAVNF